jgi:hypothetical protein
MQGRSTLVPFVVIMLGAFWTQLSYAQQIHRSDSTAAAKIPLSFLQSLIAPGTITYEPASLSSGKILRAAITELNTNCTVELENSLEASFQAEKIIITPGFWASPGSGQVMIKPHACE